MKIASDGLPNSLVPMVFGITGYGRTAKGAIEILELLPFEYVKPEDLPKLMESASKNP